MKKAIFLDRDGVLNEVLSNRVKFVNSPKDLYLLEGAAEAVAELSSAGYEVFVVTNQGGVGLGYLKEHKLREIHDTMVTMIKEHGGHIKEVAYCPHKPKEGCGCRKPNAGMLLDLAARHDLDLSGSVMVGDHERDIEAGKKAGCRTVFIGTEDTSADEKAPTLQAAVPLILTLLKHK